MKMFIPYADTVEKLLADMAALNQTITTETSRRAS